MITTTRWTDEKNDSLLAIENLLLAAHPDEILDDTASYMNWSIEKQFLDNKNIQLNGKNVEYNVYTFSVDYVPGGMQAEDDMTMRRSGFVVPYLSAGKVRYIIDRNSDALTLLRKMLGYTKKGEIVISAMPVSGDMFVWLISKVYTGDNLIESNSDALADLTVDTILEFKENTKNLLTNVSNTDETFMIIIYATEETIASLKLLPTVTYLFLQEEAVSLLTTSNLAILTENKKGFPLRGRCHDSD